MKISKTSIIAREAQHWAKFKRPKHPPASKNQAKKNPADSNSAGNNKQSKQSSNMTEDLLKSIKGQEIKIGKGQKI